MPKEKPKKAEKKPPEKKPRRVCHACGGNGWLNGDPRTKKGCRNCGGIGEV